MKKIITVLIFLLLPVLNVFSAEVISSPETTDTVEKEQQKSQNAVPRPSPQLPVPQNISPDSITPEQIRSFLSKTKEDNYIILNFDNADLKDVINTISSITNENFILSPGLDARITIHSAKKIPVSEVLNVFESVLEANGMSLVKSGEFYKIISGTTAKQKPIEVRKGSEAEAIPYVDRSVTQLVPVQYVPVTEISTVLTPMLSQFGSIIPNPRNNLLIINDLSSNIIRLLKVLKEIDVNAFKNTRMFFFKPRYSDVLSLSNELTEVLNALNLTREGIALVPIERINSLVVFSSSPTLLKTVEGWLRKLDEEVMTGQNIFIYPVQNVKAESIAEILKVLYEAEDGTKPKATTQKRQTTTRTTTKRRTIRTPATQQPKSGSSRVEILTFEPTNSLVILAPPGIYREIVETIKKIDVYPREVLIEAIIAEVTLSDSDQYGIQWSVLHNISYADDEYDARGQYRSGQKDVPSLPGLIKSNFADNLAGLPTGGVSYVVFRPEKLIALITALASESKVNILSSPRLLVRDQEEATIEVGTDVPTATSTTTATTTETLTQNIEYRTVGIKLNIKPTISEEKTVVLDVEQEVSSLGADQQVGQEGTKFPSFNTTKAKTSIVVPDKQAIIIGGIMEETSGKSYDGVPLLSRLPILGPLFRYTIDSITKKELIIIITPHVVANRTEADALTKDFLEKLKELKDFLKENEAQIDIMEYGEVNSGAADEP